MRAPENFPTVVVGAGIAGLSCARALADAGRPVVVIDRARGVGGRCATRRFEGQPIDFGVTFLHGRDPEFLRALAAVPDAAVPGWPRIILGAGRPCQPEAFAPGERRLAFVRGVHAFPKHLAAGLDVRLDARVVSFAVEPDGILLHADDRNPIRARTVVMALAVEQTQQLLAASAFASPEMATARALLSMVRGQPCLSVIAGYPADVPAPAFHVCYPEDSRVLQVLAHDSTKRREPSFTAFVYQAHPRWSRERAGDEGWPLALLAEAARILGPWAAEPRFFHSHRWRYARTDRGAEMAAPVLLRLGGGARLGLAGEVFAPGGGVEAAWISGRQLARKILAEE